MQRVGAPLGHGFGQSRTALGRARDESQRRLWTSRPGRALCPRALMQCQGASEHVLRGVCAACAGTRLATRHQVTASGVSDEETARQSIQPRDHRSRGDSTLLRGLSRARIRRQARNIHTRPRSQWDIGQRHVRRNTPSVVHVSTNGRTKSSATLIRGTTAGLKHFLTMFRGVFYNVRMAGHLNSLRIHGETARTHDDRRL